jgi:hypothetical protein
MDMTRREFLKITVVSTGAIVAGGSLLTGAADLSPEIPDAADATWGDPPVIGDLWVATDDADHLYLWNGTTWEDVQDIPQTSLGI